MYTFPNCDKVHIMDNGILQYQIGMYRDQYTGTHALEVYSVTRWAPLTAADHSLNYNQNIICKTVIELICTCNYVATRDVTTRDSLQWNDML